MSWNMGARSIYDKTQVLMRQIILNKLGAEFAFHE